MENTKNAHLKQCPFCGGKAKIFDESKVAIGNKARVEISRLLARIDSEVDCGFGFGEIEYEVEIAEIKGRYTVLMQELNNYLTEHCVQ